ncbi:hypothetical protein SUNI508_04425 [Seiridium unicorne]|uniref:Uncharacterized protein n=1 Tax=Seiridium unicorne TaxID=138068 RepID=A0ABR2V9D0_9PEZI
MPAFFAKRGTTMPPNIRDDHSDDFSHGSTLKMDMSDGDTSTRKRNKRPGTSMIVSIVLLVLLVGVSVAAGICYLNHMHTVDDINRWVDEGRVSPSSATSRALDGLQKRQQYGYGNPPSSNVTTSAPTTILSTTMSNGTATTASASDVFSETAPGIPITVTPFWPSVGSTITQTVTSNINYTVSPSVQSSLVHESVTVTVGVNNTLTLSAPTLLSSLTETVSVTSTGAVTETPSSEDQLTVTRTTLQPITVSAPNNTSIEESTLSQVTVTVSGTVFPLPASSITTATAAGVTGAPPAWTSNTSGWNSTISSGFEGPTGTMGTASVAKTLGTVSVTVTTVVSVSTSCSEVPGSTATSNDAITTSVPQSASSSTLSTSSLATVEPPVTLSKGSTTSTTTCTETLTSTPISQSAASSSALFYTTETETQLISGKTKTVTVTTEVTKSTTASMPGGYSAQADTTTPADTTTVVSTTFVQVTTTATRDPELSSTASLCVLAPTVTVTVVSDSNQITVKDVSSMMLSSPASISAAISSSQVTSISSIPLISISPNTTVIVSAPDRKTMSVITKTITSDMTTVSVDAVSVSASSSTSTSMSSSNMMSHSVSDLSTSHTAPTFSTTQYYSLPTGGNMSMYATGTPTGIIYSTKTVMGNHTSTGVPIVPVTSAGSKRRAGPFGGHGGQEQKLKYLTSQLSATNNQPEDSTPQWLKKNKSRLLSYDYLFPRDGIHGDEDESTTHEKASESQRSHQSPRTSSSPGAQTISSWPEAEEAESLLRLFRRKMMPIFPFVIIPPGMTSEQLYMERPFMWKGVMLEATCTDGYRQLNLGRKLLKDLSEALLTKPRKSVDLLQGLLLYMAWYWRNLIPELKGLLTSKLA